MCQSAHIFKCLSCVFLYPSYKLLLHHMFWKHGTESCVCSKCGLKKWKYAQHLCYILPFDEGDYVCQDYCDFETVYDSKVGFGGLESSMKSYCVCGEVKEGQMIGCDGAWCAVQWYHFECVGVVTPPDGEWLCPNCAGKQKLLSTEQRQRERWSSSNIK